MKTINDYFTISPYQIWDLWDFSWKLLSPDNIPTPLERKCILEIWKFYEHKGLVKGISEFRKTLGFSRIENYALRNEIRDMAGYGVYISPSYHINEEGINEPLGIFITRDIIPDFNNSVERHFFEKLFPYQFISFTGDFRDRFLQHHLDSTFNSNKSEFLKFLNRIKADANNILSTSHTDVMNDWINESLQTVQGSQKKTPSPIAIAYAIKFHIGSGNNSKSDKDLFEEFSSRFHRPAGSIKTEYKKLKKLTERNKLDHMKNMQYINQAISISSYKASRYGMKFKKEINN